MGTLVTAALYPQIWKDMRLELNGFYTSKFNQTYHSTHPNAKVKIINGTAKLPLKNTFQYATAANPTQWKII